MSNSLPVGSRLGPYEISALLGVGAMGEVYRARDTRLGRTVALKVLPAEATSDPERRQSFEEEARTVAGLNHPNICVLYDADVLLNGVFHRLRHARADRVVFDDEDRVPQSGTGQVRGEWRGHLRPSAGRFAAARLHELERAERPQPAVRLSARRLQA